MFNNPPIPRHGLADYEKPIYFNSFAGSDMTCTIRIDDIGYFDPQNEKSVPVYKTFAELQTLSISTFRNVFPVRRLGESQPHSYTRGARTIGGSLIFAQFSHDVFFEVYKMSGSQEVYDAREPFFVDQLPEFDIIVTAANEYGTISNLIVGGVTLQNTGTTLSIHDIYTEATFGYVARFFIPMSENLVEMDLIRQQFYQSGTSATTKAAEQLYTGTNDNTEAREAALRLLLTDEGLDVL